MEKDTMGNRGAPGGSPGDGPPRLQAPHTAASIADHVRRALDAADLDEFAVLLSPDVQWGPPGDPMPPCRNRDQVLRWYAKGRAKGRRATVTEVEVHGNALLVGVTLENGEQRWQVMRVGPEGVNDIRGFEDRHSATEKLSR
jgi:SnoaL-like domain